MRKPEPPADEAESASSQDEPLGLRERLLELLGRVQFITYTTLVLLLMALGYFWPRIFILVPAGHRAVMFRYFKGGTVTGRIWGEGINVIPPWDNLSQYDIRLQQATLKLQVLSEEGLSLGATVNINYRLNQEMLGYLQQDVGTEYFERLIRPQVEAHVRRVLGTHQTHEIYAGSGEVLQELSRVPKIGGLVRRGTAAPAFSAYVEILDLKLVAMDLPKLVEAAIAEKFRQEQLMLEYRYKLEREMKESERKRTEAAGVRDFMSIAGLPTADYLRLRSVEAAQELAKSGNSKVLMLGGAGSLPVILNLGEGQSGAPASASPPTSAPAAAAVPTAGPAPAGPLAGSGNPGKRPPPAAATDGKAAKGKTGTDPPDAPRTAADPGKAP